MHTLHIEHAVTDFDAWNTAFSRFADLRQQSGVRNRSFGLTGRCGSRQSLGQLGHKMLSADGDLVVIDEWPTAEAFTTFFANAPRMADFLAGAGIQGEPAITVLDSIDDIPGTF